MASRRQKQLKTGTDDLGREEKVFVLKECLSAIGSRIEDVVVEKRRMHENAEKWRKHLWV